MTEVIVVGKQYHQRQTLSSWKHTQTHDRVLINLSCCSLSGCPRKDKVSPEGKNNFHVLLTSKLVQFHSLSVLIMSTSIPHGHFHTLWLLAGDRGEQYYGRISRWVYIKRSITEFHIRPSPFKYSCSAQVGGSHILILFCVDPIATMVHCVGMNLSQLSIVNVGSYGGPMKRL